MMFRKMQTNRIAPMVERGYREGTKFQWVRETAINAIEAGATKISSEMSGRQPAPRAYIAG